MKISVITISWNAANTIEGTLTSTLNQNCEDFEIIIVDGGSTDATLDIVARLVKSTSFPSSRIKIISEKDKGVYDAMNKGCNLAEGEYVLFMNCGDEFYDNTVLSKFVDVINRGEDYDVYYGNTLMDFYEGKGIYHEEEGSLINPVMPFIHQSAITKTTVLLKHPYDLSYKICADFELYYWMRKNGFKFKHEDFIVSNYDAKEGLSENNPLMIRRETDLIQGISDNPNYKFTKIFQKCTIGLIQPIKDIAPRWMLNKYFRWRKKHIIWVN